MPPGRQRDQYIPNTCGADRWDNHEYCEDCHADQPCGRPHRAPDLKHARSLAVALPVRAFPLEKAFDFSPLMFQEELVPGFDSEMVPQPRAPLPPVGQPHRQATLFQVRQRDRGKAGAGKSTLNRLELTPADADQSARYKKIALDLAAVDQTLVDIYIQRQASRPTQIVLDLDATDDRLHGRQEGRFFHGYYGGYCYLPLYIFAGEQLLCARLREANQDASAGALEQIARIVTQLRRSWPGVEIVLRADSGFCREELMSWCERNGVDYVFGLAKNTRLLQRIRKALNKARRRFAATGRAARVFAELRYRTRESWSRKRRVVAKAERLEKGDNPRFVVSSLDAGRLDARSLYEDLYCARGEMENRIKEQQLDLFADRTSTSLMRSNQIRLYFSSIAYCLLQALRDLGLEGTKIARAQCSTIRQRLLKIGARVRLTARKVWISMATGHPAQGLFAAAYGNLERAPPMGC